MSTYEFVSPHKPRHATNIISSQCERDRLPSLLFKTYEQGEIIARLKPDRFRLQVYGRFLNTPMKVFLYARLRETETGSLVSVSIRRNLLAQIAGALMLAFGMAFVVSWVKTGMTKPLPTAAYLPVIAVPLMWIIMFEVHRWIGRGEPKRMLEFVTNALSLTPAGTASPLRIDR